MGIETSPASPPAPASTPTPRDVENAPGIGDSGSTPVRAAQVTPTPEVPSTRLALPANWFMPTRAARPVNCGSPFHTGNAAFAADISLFPNSNVYAAQGGIVTDVDEHPGIGYGKFIVIKTPVDIADEERDYIHGYAHLNDQDVEENDTVTPGQIIGQSGCTGTDPCSNHLHFHVSKLNEPRGPVDLTPMVGFTPNLYYPNQRQTCGNMAALIPPGDYPLVIESVGFTERSASSGNHQWLCLPGGHTTECRMTAKPDNGTVKNPLSLPTPVTSFDTARVDYDNVFVPETDDYYVWVCAKGGSGRMTFHIAEMYELTDSGDRLYSTWGVWQWTSRGPNEQRPTVNLPTSIVGPYLIDSTVNMLMREDGFRYDRILLSKDIYYSPNNNIRCGGY